MILFLFWQKVYQLFDEIYIFKTYFDQLYFPLTNNFIALNANIII